MLAFRSLYVLFFETISEWLRWYGVLTLKKKETHNSRRRVAMMKLRAAKVGDGLHHSEVVVSIHTDKGDEGLVLDKRSFRDGFVSIGFPIRAEGDAFLVELPRETSTGNWRVWVDKSQLIPEKEVA